MHQYFLDCSKVDDSCQDWNQTLLDGVQYDAGLDHVEEVEVQKNIGHWKKEKYKQNAKVGLLRSNGRSLFPFNFKFVVLVVRQ